MTALPRLYAILDLDLLVARNQAPVPVFEAWLDAGVRLIQLRAKHLAAGPQLRLAQTLATASAAAGAMFVVNDRADIARLSGATGVHVGQTDLTPTDARAVVGSAAIVGVSTHNDAEVQAALGEPISYLAIGPVFATSSKAQPDAVVGPDAVRRVVSSVAGSHVPVVAIGGITLERAPEILKAGAASVAVISDLLVGDPGERARAYLDALGDEFQ